MDISPESLSAMKQESIRSQIDTRVARKALDVIREQGDAAIELIRGAAEAQRADNARRRGGVDVLA